MKRNHLYLFVLALSASVISSQQGMSFAQSPKLKVDICEPSRMNSDEILEPGFSWWKFKKDVTSDYITIDGIKCTISLVEPANGLLRAGWDKSFVQKAENKAKNGRLTGDGANFDPDVCGTFVLRLEGLPKGKHTIQTYHNSWKDPAKTYGYPITVKCNGVVVHKDVSRTFQEATAANATLLTTQFTIANDGDAVELSFSTSEDNPPSATVIGTKKSAHRSPLLNGFELNTVSIVAQAKMPDPTSGNLHVDGDSGEYLMSWSPANASVKQHKLYIATDSSFLETMAEPVAVKNYADTTYLITGLYSMNTYYWRVDEVDADGTVTPGPVWTFRPRQLAFPGAEGYGRYATGGRGGIVYHVTNLKHDHKPGSLLYGLVDLKGPRTIVFDVSGLIEMDFGSFFANPYVTIAAQTAPGKGICLKAANLGMGTESICRFLRAKRGYGNTGNAMGLGVDQVIVDHTTAAWGTDETVSGRSGKMLSFQYSMIAEALGIADHKNYDVGKNHGFAATIDGKIGSWHHNLLANCNGRNWSMGGGMDGSNTAIGQMDLFNNVVYNWYGRCTDGMCHEVNFVNNYYKMGPDTKNTMLFTQNYENIATIQSTFQAYVSGNIRENKNHTLSYDKLNDTYTYALSNGAVDPNTRTDQYHYKTFVNEPFFPSYAKIHTAKDAFKVVCSDAGATMPCRDNQHLRIIRETVNGTYTYTGSRSGIKGEIDHEKDITGEANSGWEEWPEEKRPANFDTDQDGMPNWYEKLIGSDENVADNNDDPDRDGWTLLEDYLEFMAHPYLMISPNGAGTYDVAQCFLGFTKSPVYTIIADECTLVTPSISGSVVSVQAGSTQGINTLTMKVTDAEGSTFEQKLSIAVTDFVTGIDKIKEDIPEEQSIAKREFFTIDGKEISASQMQSHETYILKTTYTSGKTKTTKILKD